jgi:hypothetical protein
LGWIFHLCKKEKITKEQIQVLIKKCHEMGVGVDFHA